MIKVEHKAHIIITLRMNRWDLVPVWFRALIPSFPCGCVDYFSRMFHFDRWHQCAWPKPSQTWQRDTSPNMDHLRAAQRWRKWTPELKLRTKDGFPHSYVVGANDPVCFWGLVAFCLFSHVTEMHWECVMDVDQLNTCEMNSIDSFHICTMPIHSYAAYCIFWVSCQSQFDAEPTWLNRPLHTAISPI